jgi:hypothetical protein
MTTSQQLASPQHERAVGATDGAVLGYRLLAVVALTIVAVAHVPVAVTHVHEVPYLGFAFYGFIVVIAAGIGSLIVENRRLVWQGLLALNLAAVTLFTISRVIGLPGASDDRGDWLNPAGLVSVTAELVVVAVAALVITRTTSSSASPKR